MGEPLGAWAASISDNKRRVSYQSALILPAKPRNGKRRQDLVPNESKAGAKEKVCAIRANVENQTRKLCRMHMAVL